MSTTIKHVEAAIPAADSFVPRHIGPDEKDVAEMVKALGFPSLDELIDATVPRKIRWRGMAYELMGPEQTRIVRF